MSPDKSQPEPQEVYYAAEQYLPNLSELLQSRVKILLAEAQDGQKRDTIILSLLSDDPEARQWMRQALYGEQTETMRSYDPYDPLAGGGPVVKANSQWKCPQCGFIWRVQRKGRPVPNCPTDQSVLVRVKA